MANETLPGTPDWLGKSGVPGVRASVGHGKVVPHVVPMSFGRMTYSGQCDRLRTSQTKEVRVDESTNQIHVLRASVLSGQLTIYDPL